LINGKIIHEEVENGVKIEKELKPAVNKNSEFWIHTKNRQQTIHDNSCGFWLCIIP